MQKIHDEMVNIKCTLGCIKIEESADTTEKNMTALGKEKKTTGSNVQSLIGFDDESSSIINSSILETVHKFDTKHNSNVISTEHDEKSSTLNKEQFHNATLRIPTNSRMFQNNLETNENIFSISNESIVQSNNYQRRESISNAAISSSIATCLVGISSQIPKEILNVNHRINTEDIDSHIGFPRRKSKLGLLRLHMPQPHSWSNFATTSDSDDLQFHHHDNYHHHHHHHHYHFPHIPVPTITITNDGSARKFSFGIRRYSQTTIPNSSSMVSLWYPPLANYIAEDDFSGFQNFLECQKVTIDERDVNGGTVLTLAASKGKIQFVRELINHGADVNVADFDNWTPLLCAAKEGHSEVCFELLENGANLEHRDVGGWTALMWASYKGRTATVTLLLSRGADVNAHGNYHISSLLWASGRGHTDIVRELVGYGAKINVGDKYGTTALVWAARKGNMEIVDTLLKAGANVDTAGMYSWTPLIVAALGNHVDVVMLLLIHKPNVNALDKDGYTALAIASREGYHEIVSALLNAGAYINIQDRAGDTNLIHAVKGGHRSVVEALLKKHVEVNICGKDKKTATYIAVEKGNVPILKLLLNANADIELATKDGDTPLLRAVRSRNAEIVQILLDMKAKVTATDKKGDTALHIAMRARSKTIVEILLRNPKNSQLLYRPNREGETPYNIDVKHPKTILGQIFGARRLNTNEDNENMLGYDLYSSALADILSEPSLSTPITVGLYAKWGSGKSFLLNKLRDEMKNFVRQYADPTFEFSILLFIVTFHVSLLLSVISGLALQSWIAGISLGITLFSLVYGFLVLTSYANKSYDWDWPYHLTVTLAVKLNSLKLLLQVIFCHPPGKQLDDESTVRPIKFHFTDQMRVGTTSAGENAVVQMIGSLYDSIENEFGSLATRLYRAFRPKQMKSNTSWTWRRLCCLPYIIIFEFCFCSLLIGMSILTIYLIDKYSAAQTIEPDTVQIVMICVGLILTISVIANLYAWSKTLITIIFSQRRHLQRSIAKLDTLKSEGFLQILKTEVSLMTEMVKCLDRFTAQQSRLVLIVDGLDSCEQGKVLLVLDAIQALFSDNNCPFIIILAIDPHIIAKAVELNSRQLFSESNIGGHDYLRNMVHVPFYLQNSGLRKVKVSQQMAQYYKKTSWNEADENVNYATTSAISHSVSNRRLSSESSVMNSNEKLKPPSRKGSRKMRLSESIASSIGSNLNRMGGAQDLNKMLLTDDYFSDVNPRSMRRLMNVVYVTGRLLKAFRIDFNWYHLASWINITEQWPYRTSWIIFYHEMSEEALDDSTSLKAVYDKVRPQIPVVKDAKPLLEMDRDERKLDVFLTYHRASLLISDMKLFLPFTINLDPYIKKKIKDDQQEMDDDFASGMQKNPWQLPMHNEQWANNNKTTLTNRQAKFTRTPSVQGQMFSPWTIPPVYDWSQWPWMSMPPNAFANTNLSATTSLPSEILEMKLSNLSVDNVCDLLSKIEELNPNSIESYKNLVRENNINGKVLLHCDIGDLKQVLKMTFGDWELFRIIIISLREQERTSVATCDENSRSVRFTMRPEQINRKDQRDVQSSSQRAPTYADKEKSISRTDGPPRRDQTKHSVMEKQVTLEEQMICGALQTLNEEACEDVLDVPTPTIVPPDSLAGGRSRSHSTITAPDTDFVLLQPSPELHWVAVHNDAESSDDSSQESITQLHRSNSQRSITSQRSIKSTYSHGNHARRNTNTISRPSSLVASPPASPRPAYRSKSIDDYPVNNVTVEQKSTSIMPYMGNSTPMITDEIAITLPSSQSSPKKLNKFKNRFMGTNVPTCHSSMPNVDSDDESTPLVSELSTPSHTQSDNVFAYGASPVSNVSIRSLPQTSERYIDTIYNDAVSLVIHESAEVRASERHDAEEWDSPETPV